MRTFIFIYLLVNENLLRLIVLDIVEVIRVFMLALTRNYFLVKTVMLHPLHAMINRYHRPSKKRRGKKILLSIWSTSKPQGNYENHKLSLSLFLVF